MAVERDGEGSDGSSKDAGNKWPINWGKSYGVMIGFIDLMMMIREGEWR